MMTKQWMRAVLAGGLMTMLAGPALAHEYRLGSLEIAHPWARATAPGQPVAAGYLAVTNNGAEADRLVSVETPIARAAELHDMAIENGIMKMRQVQGGIELPAGETVELAPGGLHVMILGPKDPLVAGERVPLSLVFEKAGTIEVELAVEKPAAQADDHGDHGDHHDHDGHDDHSSGG